jgi:homeobox protein cut-like
LDEQSLQILSSQPQITSSRKQLADQTKDFKKLSDGDKLIQFKVLLKGYQTEIDTLTKLKTNVDNAFLRVYRLLAGLPDPVPLLSSLNVKYNIGLTKIGTSIKNA